MSSGASVGLESMSMETRFDRARLAHGAAVVAVMAACSLLAFVATHPLHLSGLEGMEELGRVRECTAGNCRFADPWLNVRYALDAAGLGPGVQRAFAVAGLASALGGAALAASLGGGGWAVASSPPLVLAGLCVLAGSAGPAMFGDPSGRLRLLLGALVVAWGMMAAAIIPQATTSAPSNSRRRPEGSPNIAGPAEPASTQSPASTSGGDEATAQPPPPREAASAAPPRAEARPATAKARCTPGPRPAASRAYRTLSQGSANRQLPAVHSRTRPSSSIPSRPDRCSGWVATKASREQAAITATTAAPCASRALSKRVSMDIDSRPTDAPEDNDRPPSPPPPGRRPLLAVLRVNKGDDTSHGRQKKPDG